MPFSNLFVKKVVQDLTSGGIDWQREKWQSGLGSKFIHQGEKNAAKYADEVIVLSKGVQDYFKETYGRETHFIPNGVNRPQIREASLITDKFGLKKDSYILFLGRLVPEKGIRYLVEAFKNVKTDKKLVIAGGSSDTDSFMEKLKELAKGDDRILFTGFVQGAMLDELWIPYTFLIKKPIFISGYICKKLDVFNRPAVAKFGILGFIAWAFMFSNIPQSFFLPIVVPCFIAAFCCVPITGIMKKGLLLLGKNSTYMWLTHSWLIYKFLQPVIFSMHDVVANLIVLVITDLPVAFCFKSLEGKVNKLLSDKCSCVTQ